MGLDVRSPIDLWRTYSYVPVRVAHMSPWGEALAVPGGLLAIVGIPVADVNLGFVYGPDDPGDAMRVFVARLRERGLPGYVVLPAELGDELEGEAAALGLKPGPRTPLMLADFSGGPSPAERTSRFVVDEVRDEAALLAAREIPAAAFSEEGGDFTRQIYRPLLLRLPGVHLFTAREGETLVSYSTTIYDGEIVWLLDVGTHPEHRGKGAATELLLATMDWWRERGPRVFGLGAEPEARPLYDSLGFRVAAESRMWLVEGPATGATSLR
jgi:GNAT superfamily N-acetyltransferase